MFEQRLTRTERLWRDLRWAVSPERCSVVTLRQRVRGALAWFLAGLLIAAIGGAVYARQFPGAVVALEPVLEHADNRFTLLRLRFEHWGVEVSCHLVLRPEFAGWTVTC